MYRFFLVIAAVLAAMGIAAAQDFPNEPIELISVQGALLFTALSADGQTIQLWRSDGTEDGTVFLADVVPNQLGSSVGGLTNVDGTLFFAVYNNAVGTGQLWRSDTTAGGTAVIKEIQDIDTLEMVAAGGALFFRAYSFEEGWELWRSDGTADGTGFVEDIYPGSVGAAPDEIVARGSEVFFRASDLEHGRELWRSDGTADGTYLVRDITPSKSGKATAAEAERERFGLSIAVHDTVVYFGADDGTNGRELWRTDGSSGATVMVRDILPGGDGSFPISLTSAGAYLYFVADDGGAPYALWRSDGTEAGTVPLNGICGEACYEAISPQYLTSYQGRLFFASATRASEDLLWRSGGTSDSTVVVNDTWPAGPGDTFVPQQLTTAGGLLFFTLTEKVVNGDELWKSDGTAEGTQLVHDIAPAWQNAFPEELTPVGVHLFFIADDKENGRSLWFTDGTADGTVLVKDNDTPLNPPTTTEGEGTGPVVTEGENSPPPPVDPDDTSIEDVFACNFEESAKAPRAGDLMLHALALAALALLGLRPR